MSLGYNIEIIGLEEQIKLLKDMDISMTAELRRAMDLAMMDLQAGVRPFVPVNQGRLVGSLGSKVVTLGPGSVQGVFGSSIKDSPYPQVMEFGASPFFPNPDSLERWVHLKLGVSEKDAPGVAFKIARGISRVGIKGRFFMKRGFDAMKSIMIRRFELAAQRITEALSNGRS